MGTSFVNICLVYQYYVIIVFRHNMVLYLLYSNDICAFYQVDAYGDEQKNNSPGFLFSKCSASSPVTSETVENI